MRDLSLSPGGNRSPRRFLAGLLGAAALLLGANASSALEFATHSADSETVNAIEVKGKIETGDAMALQAYIAKLPQKKVTVVYLNSLGGALEEGMALGRLFHRAKIRTAVIGKDVICSSACATAFLGGRDPETAGAWRVKGSTARLGFHSFKIDWEDKSYTAQDMSNAIAEAMDLGKAQDWPLKDAEAEWGYEMANYGLGSNSRVRGKNARELLGWAPKTTSVLDWIKHDMLKA